MEDALLTKALETIIEMSYEHSRKIEHLERVVAAVQENLGPDEAKRVDATMKRLRDKALQYRPSESDLSEQLLEVHRQIRDWKRASL